MPANNATGATKWTPEQDAHLTKLWTDGASAAEISVEMNCGYSRSAILGRVHRLKLPQREPRTRVHQVARPEGKKGQRGNPGQPKAKGIVARQRSAALAIRQNSGNAHFRPGSLPAEDDAGVDVTSLLGFADRRIGHQCAWVHGDPLEAGSGFCGRPVKEGTEWCPEHHARAYSGRGGA